MPTGKPANAEKYIKERAKGKTKIDAYNAACPDSIASDNSKSTAAWRLETKYKQRLDDLKRKADAGAVMDLKQALAALAEIAADERAKDTDRIAALDKIIKAAGGYSERHEISIDGGLSLEDKRTAAAAWIDKLTETP